MKLLFFFIDGIGLGKNDPTINPFARALTPTLDKLLGGRRLIKGSAPTHTLRASLLSIDATLGINGVPQSATGQAAILTGINIPNLIGYHFGPWPNQIVVDSLGNGNLFSYLKKSGKRAAFLNAYPPSYFESINSGMRIYSAIPQAVISAGYSLFTEEDLKYGHAVSADFTGQGWRDRLNLPDTPVISPYQAGSRLAHLTNDLDFAFFEYWLTDYAGHNQEMDKACSLLNTIDTVIDGIIASWNDQEGIILITSDHGNMEDLSTRRHTINQVPVILIGAPNLRREFIRVLRDLTDITPTILKFLDAKDNQ